MLIITDRPSRTDIDFDLFDLKVSFALPEKFKAGNKVNQNIAAQYFDLKNPDIDVSKFDLVVIDLRKSFSKNILNYISDNILDSSTLVHLEWSDSRNSIWYKFYRNFFLSKNNGKNISNLKTSSDVPDTLKLKWLFYIVPGLHKPVHFIRPNFQSNINTLTKSPLKNWLKKNGGFYLQKNQTVAIAQKEYDEKLINPIEELILAICKEKNICSPDYDTVIKRLIISGSQVLILDITIDGNGYFVRFPLGVSSLGRLKQQHSILKYLSDNNIKIVPKPIILEKTVPFQYFIQEKIVGEKNVRILYGKNNQGVDKLYDEAFKKISEIHSAFGENILIEKESFTTYVKPMFNLINERLTDYSETKPAIQKIEKYLFNTLQGKRLKTSVCHGDFKIENCIYNKDGELQGIIDWDMSEQKGLVLVDVASVFTNSIRLKYYQKLGLAKFMLNFTQVPGELLKSYQDYCTESDMDMPDPMTLVVYYWIDRIWKLLLYRSFTDKAWLEANIFPVLNRIDYFIDQPNN
ncbi:MAG: aminoglycoside phosphotransferase family protein [Calditrichaeota bacterium]|nr:aminoglycoside phosphotransferase family protein [Calditrichota bacterium]